MTTGLQPVVLFEDVQLLGAIFLLTVVMVLILYGGLLWW